MLWAQRPSASAALQVALAPLWRALRLGMREAARDEAERKRAEAKARRLARAAAQEAAREQEARRSQGTIVQQLVGQERLSPTDVARLSAPLAIDGFAGAADAAAGAVIDRGSRRQGGWGAAQGGMGGAAAMQDDGDSADDGGEHPPAAPPRRQRRSSVTSVSSALGGDGGDAEGDDRSAASRDRDGEGSVANGRGGGSNQDSASAAGDDAADGAAAADGEEDSEKKDSASPWLRRFRRLLLCFSLVHSIEHDEVAVEAGQDVVSGQVRAAAPAIVGSEGLEQADEAAVLQVDFAVLSGTNTAEDASALALRKLRRLVRVATLCGPTSLQQVSTRRSAALAASAPALLNSMARGDSKLLTSLVASLIRMPDTRQLIDFDNKRRIFRTVVRRLQGNSAREVLSLAVRRDRVLEDVQSKLFGLKASELRKRLSVSFRGEAGVDAGGLTKELYTLLARDIFKPAFALFEASADSSTYQPSANSSINDNHLNYFRVIGRVVGKAICDGHVLDVHFSRAVYKHMLGLPLGVEDLEAADPEFFRSIKFLLDNEIDDMYLGITFSVDEDHFGEKKQIELVPGGDDVEVTDANKHAYVKLVVKHRLTSRIRAQLESFLRGFYELVPPELARIFTVPELEMIISGTPEIDVVDMRRHSRYRGGYRAEDKQVRWLWQVIDELSEQDKARLLMFVTGTSKIPVEGFSSLRGVNGPTPFTIAKIPGGDERLPQSHTCFNTLDLPAYSSMQTLRKRLLTAIRLGGEGFGLA